MTMPSAPKIIRSVRELRAWSRAQRLDRRRIALVPTMGALHDGHLALIDIAQKHCERTVVSIFVNPTQFNESADFASYPRTFDVDAAQCQRREVDVIFAPTAEEMYPNGSRTTIRVGPIATRWEGEHRPGHFDGVATIVAKLFLACEPDVAVFGTKDFQQLAVIRQVALDLNLPADIVGVPTIREPDGLAMSSRNVRLSNDQRQAACTIFRAMNEAQHLLTDTSQSIEDIRQHVVNEIEMSGGVIDYVAIVDPVTLEPIEDFSEAQMLVAATFGTVRLIDNLRLRRDPSPTFGVR